MKAKNRNVHDANLPLTESAYLIMISLIDARHGYGVMQNVEVISAGRVKLGPGTLYGSLKTMVSKRLIEELDGDNPRRRYYRITQRGLALLEDEITRLQEMVDVGKQALHRKNEGEINA